MRRVRVVWQNFSRGAAQCRAVCGQAARRGVFSAVLMVKKILLFFLILIFFF
jgi:hypothetical protein